MGFLLVIVLAMLLCLVVLLPLRLLSRGARGRADVLRDGVEAMAVITKAWETGTRVRDRARVGMVLSVEPRPGEPFVVEVQQTVPRPQMAQLRPGHVIVVRYLPSDPTQVVVVNPG